MGPYVDLADEFAAALAPALGKNTAQRALERAAAALGRHPEALHANDRQALCERLGPMLETLVGRAVADDLLRRLRCGPGE